MKIIEMKKFRKIRVGFKNDQDLFIKNFAQLKSKINANSNFVNEKRTVVIELALARHASSYGLLGATFTPLENDEKVLSLEVRFNNDKLPFKESISNDNDYAYLGLEEDFAQSVLSSVTEYFQNQKIPSGKLVFHTAAQCDVGSSIVIFSCITKILLDILLNEYDRISDEEVERICDNQITN